MHLYSANAMQVRIERMCKKLNTTSVRVYTDLATVSRRLLRFAVGAYFRADWLDALCLLIFTCLPFGAGGFCILKAISVTKELGALPRPAPPFGASTFL